MGSLQGPVVCPNIRAKHAGFCSLPINRSLMAFSFRRGELWGFTGINGLNAKLPSISHKGCARKCKTSRCSFSSSSDDNGSTAENFNEKDEEYVESSVVEAGMIS